jgi:hypothetical protein
VVEAGLGLAPGNAFAPEAQGKRTVIPPLKGKT